MVLWFLMPSYAFLCLLEAASHPINHLCRIRTLKDRLGRSIDNRKKGRDALDSAISWRIIVLVQITIIPGNLRAEIKKGLRIQSLTRAAPIGAKTDHHNRIMRFILFDETLEKLLAREESHPVVRHGYHESCCEERWQ